MSQRDTLRESTLAYLVDTGSATQRDTLLPIGIVVVALIVAGVLLYLGATHSGDVWLEVAKGGIQLLVIVILGGAVAAGFRMQDDRRRREGMEQENRLTNQRRREDIEREDRERLDAYRADFVDELWGAYHRVKAVRRILTAYGFGSMSGEFTVEQCREFDQQMKELDDAQLTLEKLKRDVEGQGDLYEPERKAILVRLKSAERYVRDVIKDWEQSGPNVRPGEDCESVMRAMSYLPGFLGSAHTEGGMEKLLSVPVSETARMVQKLRFPALGER
jgi:hypothetical protein